MDRLLSELARVKAERLRLMLRQLNITAEQRLHHSMAGGPNQSEASATRRGNPDGYRLAYVASDAVRGIGEE
jgi:hypothetical protein